MRRVTTTIWGLTSRPDSSKRWMISVSKAFTWSRMYTICAHESFLLSNVCLNDH